MRKVLAHTEDKVRKSVCCSRLQMIYKFVCYQVAELQSQMADMVRDISVANKREVGSAHMLH